MNRNALDFGANMKLKNFAVASAVLGLLFCLPVWRLVRFAAGDELFS